MAELDILKDLNIGFIGGGNMAQAIGLGLIKKGVLKPNNIWVSSRTDKTLSIWKKQGSNTTFNNYEVIQNSDLIFIAVKPQMLNDALKTCVNPSTPFQGKLYISIIVGIPLEALNKSFLTFDKSPKIIRCMPNTPLMVSEGIAVYCSLNTSERDESIMKILFSQLGVCEKVPESLMNSVGGLTGAGPAYAYLIIEGLADGAVRQGVPRESAIRFAAQVLVGAGKMVLESNKHPGQLKDEVCSPGGSTIMGVHALESGSVRVSMMNAVDAAVKRSTELSAILK